MIPTRSGVGLRIPVNGTSSSGWGLVRCGRFAAPNEAAIFAQTSPATSSNANAAPNSNADGGQLPRALALGLRIHAALGYSPRADSRRQQSGFREALGTWRWACAGDRVSGADYAVRAVDWTIQLLDSETIQTLAVAGAHGAVGGGSRDGGAVRLRDRVGWFCDQSAESAVTQPSISRPAKRPAGRGCRTTRDLRPARG